MKFPGYFLIVWDFIRYAKEHNIPVGPGRGSAAGSLVAYVMEITDIDPLQNELLFERFLNPERVSMPDIDIDFCMNRRGEVIEYVRQQYGNDQVAQIITFNTMAAKAAIKDVGRAMDMPYGEVDRIAKLIPATIGITIEQALKDSPPLSQAYNTDGKIKELIDTALRLEGLVRGAGVHAAGVVIAPEPLTELVPVTRTKDEAIVTSYDMKAVEKMGLLKMDFLGLTTLTVIDDCLKLIKANRGEDVDMATIALDDQRTFEQVFHKALTSGVFQFESGGMRDVLRRYKPNSIEHLTALNALYRPGPIRADDRRLHRAQVGTARGGVSAAGAGAAAEGDAGRHRLPGAGDADLERHRRVFAGRRGPAAPRDGQERSGGDGEAARHLHGRSGGEEVSEGSRRRVLRPDGEVRGVRLQQVALGGVCAAGVSHGVAEDALSGGVHGGAADERNVEAGECGQVHRRVPRDEHRGGAAGCADFSGDFTPDGRGDPLRAGGDQERRAQRD